MDSISRCGKIYQNFKSDDGGKQENTDIRKGPWNGEEDAKLVHCISVQGERRWNALARASGLQRTGKSCRLRWLNYLRPNLRRGNFSVEEQLLILELHSRLGNRWSRIALHLPGRTDNEIKNYWRRVAKLAARLQLDVNSNQFTVAAMGSLSSSIRINTNTSRANLGWSSLSQPSPSSSSLAPVPSETAASSSRRPCTWVDSGSAWTTEMSAAHNITSGLCPIVNESDTQMSPAFSSHRIHEYQRTADTAQISADVDVISETWEGQIDYYYDNSMVCSPQLLGFPLICGSLVGQNQLEFPETEACSPIWGED